jgi:hypothetical protein
VQFLCTLGRRSGEYREEKSLEKFLRTMQFLPRRHCRGPEVHYLRAMFSASYDRQEVAFHGETFAHLPAFGGSIQFGKQSVRELLLASRRAVLRVYTALGPHSPQTWLLT